MSETPTPAAKFGSDPSKVFYRASGSEPFITAAIAVGVAWVLKLVWELNYLIRGVFWSIDEGPGILPGWVRDFGASGFADPFWFGLGAYALLVFLLPILGSTPLPRVLIRAAIAGVGGFILLTLPGLVDAIVDGVNHGFDIGWFINDWLNWPAVVALQLTPYLALGAVIAWLWIKRRAEKAVPAA